MSCDPAVLHASPEQHFVKTHDLPGHDNFPAIVIIRDGRDSAVSYAYFALKTEHDIEHPTTQEVEKSLEEIIDADRFSGWSTNVNAWIDRVGIDNVVRYEKLVEDPVNTVSNTLGRLGIQRDLTGSPPLFQELHATVPWFFRSGKQGSWRDEMPARLHQLFLQKHGDTLIRLGYSPE